MVSGAMKEFCTCVDMSYKDDFYLFLVPGIMEDHVSWFDEIVAYIRRQLEKKGIGAAVGVGRLKKKEDEFASGLQEARIALLGTQENHISYFRYGRQEKKKLLLWEQALKSAALLSQGEAGAVADMVKDFIRKHRDPVMDDGESLAYWKAEALFYLQEVKKEVERMVGPGMEYEWDLWKKFRESSSVEDIIGWIAAGIRNCEPYMAQDGREENGYIAKAGLFIHENYRQDLSLEMVSEAVGISSFYLSRLLKQERNTTFIEILTNVRIWSAIRLLKENRKTVREICGEAGYPNITYFYKVFKKTTGLAVGTLREFS